jgi:hypothetical protein
MVRRNSVLNVSNSSSNEWRRKECCLWDLRVGTSASEDHIRHIWYMWFVYVFYIAIFCYEALKGGVGDNA